MLSLLAYSVFVAPLIQPPDFTQSGEFRSLMAKAAAQGESNARVLATVNGVPITEAQLNHAIFPLQLMPQTDAESAARMAECKKTFLDRLVDVEILNQEMNQRLGKTTAGRRTIEKLKNIADKECEELFKKEIELMQFTEDDYIRLLKAHDVSYDGRREFIQKSMIADEYLRSLVQGDPGVSQAQVEEYYREHAAEFTRQEGSGANELKPLDAQMQKLIHDKLRQDQFTRQRKQVLENLRRKAQVVYLDADGR